jgi:Xaa-Pro dipeptidase
MTGVIELSSHQISALAKGRQERLRETMRTYNVGALLTADPINIVYGCGARNMTVFGMMGPSRFLLLFANGPAVLFEYAGCEHLATRIETVDRIRYAPTITPLAGATYLDGVTKFAAEVQSLVSEFGGDTLLAVERMDFPMTDALRSHGLQLADATAVFRDARRIKTSLEIEAMRIAIDRVEGAVGEMRPHLEPGRTEVEVWSHFLQQFMTADGEYTSTRLLQSGNRTFPYFQEAGVNALQAGDLLCFDTDALGYLGYAVDFSRTFLVGDALRSTTQHELYAKAHEQLEHNASLLRAGLPYAEFASKAWTVPEQHMPYSYYCLGHGLGLCGEYPNISSAQMMAPGTPYPLSDGFEAGMIFCVESYIGDPVSRQGVKLEDQYLITDVGAERLTTFSFAESLLR